MMDMRAQPSRDGHFGPPNTFYNSNPQIYTNPFTVKNVQPPQYSQGIILNPSNVPSRTPSSQKLSCSRRSSISTNQLPTVLSQSTASQHHYLAASGQMNRPHLNRMHGNPAAFSHAPPPPQPPQLLHNSRSSGQLSTSSFSRSRSVSSHQLNQQPQRMTQSIPAVQVAYVPVMSFPPPPPRFVQPQLHQGGVLYYPGHPMVPNHVPVQTERTARISSKSSLTRARSFRQEEQEQKEKLLKASSSSSSGSTTCLSILCEDTLLHERNNRNVNNKFKGADKDKKYACILL